MRTHICHASCLNRVNKKQRPTAAAMCTHWPAVLALLLICVCTVHSTAASTQPSPPDAEEDKISGAILVHLREKMQRVGKLSSPRTKAVIQQHFNTVPEMSEQCALYVEAELTDEEIAELGSRRIIVRKPYVAPVVDKHPFGFYLATVNYSSLDHIRSDPRIVRLNSTEFQCQAMNDKANQMTRADRVHRGQGAPKRTGRGVKIAIADTGLDVSHKDIPTPVEAFDMTDGYNTNTWGWDVSNRREVHGTHVTGTALGRGALSNGQYRGAAPDADLYFYKIFTDDGYCWDHDIIEAIQRAQQVGCDVFSLSVGGLSTYMDGSSHVCQAIDTATASGMTCFVGAGNYQDKGLHYSVHVARGRTTNTFSITVANNAGQAYSLVENLNVIWIDDNPYDRNIDLSLENGYGASFSRNFSGTSQRGTEARQYSLSTYASPYSVKTYTFRLRNTDSLGATPRVHIYIVPNGIEQVQVAFDQPDPDYTMSYPALADSAIAVGAHTQRTDWTDYLGDPWTLDSVLALETLAFFSSLGPRIDGRLKPDITAPGAVTISCRPAWAHLDAASIIDNNGYPGGNADYFLMWGTSMACPHAAGVAALVLENNPWLSPARLKEILTSTASQALSPDNYLGYGLIDALDAVNQAN